MYNLGRRNFIKNTIGFGLLSSSALDAKTENIKRLVSQTGNAKNCIFLVVDGMGRGTLSIANDYSLKKFGRELNWIELLKNKHVNTSLQNTASANSLVTDSAAAGSAWGSGLRVPNGHINVTADGKFMKPLFSKAKDKGLSVGLVTTTRITHATPASFVSSVYDRNDEISIAKQYLDQEIDILMGGGKRYFSEDNNALLKAYKNNGYFHIGDMNTLHKCTQESKILGLFSDSHLPYSIDRENSNRHNSIPSLKEMFQFTLSKLSNSGSGFCLQVEAGRVDHAGHAQDIAAIIHEQLEFDKLIPIALDFVEKQPDTLLIITSDHGTGGCQLNGIGDKYTDSNNFINLLTKIKASYEFMSEELKSEKKLNKQLFKALLGIDISDNDIEIIKSMLNGEYRIYPFGYSDLADRHLINYRRDYLAANLGSYFESYFARKMGLSWTSDAHTSELVDVIALGPGANEIPQYIENYELNGFMRASLNI